MDTIQYGKWGGCIIPVGVLLGLFAVITAQPGFLSISCGGKTNHTAENNITWVTDAPYIDVGQAANIGDASELGSYLHTLRYFPKPLNKSCYQLPVTPDVPYLLRLWFVLGNFSGYQQVSGYQQGPYINFTFSIETVDMLLAQHIALSTPFPYEYISVTSGRVIYICLIRNIDIKSADPFISAIELRRLQDDLYGEFGVLEAGYALYLQERIDAGGNLTVRYPQDKFDRIWTTSFALPPSSLVYNVSSAEAVSTNNIPILVPPVVLQTALVVEESSDIILDGLSANNLEDKLLVWYFAEIKRLNASEYSRSFYVVLEGKGNGNSTQLITLPPNQSAVEHHIVCNCVTSIFQLVKAPNSTLPAMINAFEYYTRLKTENATYRQDIDALDAIRRRFGIRDWKSDPCYLRPWSGIGCYNISGLVRISEIDLSGRNLSGSVPNDIAQLTALVNLYLHNNNLSGTVEWLSEMKNLKELNIADNNFSGVIPRRLLLDCSLKLNYSGNPYLRMNKRKCFAQKSKTSRRNKLIIIISGSLFIGLASIAGMVVYRKKFSKREECAAMGSRSRVEKKKKAFIKPRLFNDHSAKSNKVPCLHSG